MMKAFGSCPPEYRIMAVWIFIFLTLLYMILLICEGTGERKKKAMLQDSLLLIAAFLITSGLCVRQGFYGEEDFMVFLKMPYGILIIMGICGFLFVGIQAFGIYKRRTNCLRENAIQESLDNLPSGIGFFDRNGMPKLMNRKMYQLCRNLAGRDIQNTASADADNTRPAETTYSVKVPEGKNPENPSPTVTPAAPTETPSEKGEPVLTITKKTDQTEAKPGSTVTYTVEVKNTGNETAKEVVIIDNLKNNKAILQKDTIKTYLQGKSFTPKKISAVSSGFRIETGKDLEKGQAVQVVYQVKLDATIKSSEVRNVASASAQNAERAETEQTLRIPSNSSENPQNPGNSDSTLKDTSASLKGNVQTGDRSPVKLIVIIGVLGIAGLIAYFSGKGRKRR